MHNNSQVRQLHHRLHKFQATQHFKIVKSAYQAQVFKIPVCLFKTIRVTAATMRSSKIQLRPTKTTTFQIPIFLKARIHINNNTLLCRRCCTPSIIPNQIWCFRHFFFNFIERVFCRTSNLHQSPAISNNLVAANWMQILQQKQLLDLIASVKKEDN